MLKDDDKCIQCDVPWEPSEEHAKVCLVGEAALASEKQANGNHEMTRFHVGLVIDVETSSLQWVGSPSDWKWDRFLDNMIGGDAHNNTELKYVKAVSTFHVNDDGDRIRTTDYDVVIEQPSNLEKSVSKILDCAQEYVADQVERYPRSDEGDAWQKEQLEALIEVRDFARDHFNNPSMGDSYLNYYLEELNRPKDPPKPKRVFKPHTV